MFVLCVMWAWFPYDNRWIKINDLYYYCTIVQRQIRAHSEQEEKNLLILLQTSVLSKKQTNKHKRITVCGVCECAFDRNNDCELDIRLWFKKINKSHSIWILVHHFQTYESVVSYNEWMNDRKKEKNNKHEHRHDTWNIYTNIFMFMFSLNRIESL